MASGLFKKIMEATKLVVDPPSGWRYGFPMVWDKEKQPELREFLKEKGYPEDDLEFALSHIRMWFPEEETKNGDNA